MEKRGKWLEHRFTVLTTLVFTLVAAILAFVSGIIVANYSHNLDHQQKPAQNETIDTAKNHKTSTNLNKN